MNANGRYFSDRIYRWPVRSHILSIDDLRLGPGAGADGELVEEAELHSTEGLDPVHQMEPAGRYGWKASI
jgi:hypothetical protein